jgi:hypothetical protein
MRIPGVDGYRLDDTFGFDRGAIQVGVIREADGRAVGTASGNLADSLIQQAQSIAQTDYDSAVASGLKQAERSSFSESGLRREPTSSQGWRWLRRRAAHRVARMATGG